MTTKLLLALVVSAAVPVLHGAVALQNGNPAQVVVTGAPANSRVEFFDGVIPVAAVSTDASGSARLPVSAYAPGHRNINVQVRGGVRVGAANLNIPARPATLIGTPVSYAVGIQPAIFASASTDPRGSAWFIAAGDGTLSVIRAQGGHFSAPLLLPGVASPRAAVIADLNGDGADDILLASETGSLAIFINDGNGAFSRSIVAGVPAGITAMALADVNDDGIGDLLVANEATHNIYLLPGSADGTFGPSTVAIEGASARSITVGDFNGDGIADLATANFINNAVTIWAGDGTGAFRSISSVSSGNGPVQLFAGDFNEDGVSDLVVVSQIDRTAEVLINDGRGNFAGGSAFGGVLAATVGHLLGSVHVDLLLQTASGLELLAGAGNGTFSSSAIVSASSAPQTVAVLDLSGAGIPSIVTADLSGVASVYTATAASADATSSVVHGFAALSVVANDAGLIRTARTQVSTSTTLSSSNTASNLSQSVTLTATVSPNTATGTVTFYEGATVLGVRTLSSGQATLSTNLLPVGAGNLTARYATNSSYTGSLSNIVSQTVTELAQNGMQSATGMIAGATPHGIIAADFNGDGITDLAVVDNAASQVAVFIGTGTGGFNTAVNYAVNGQPFGIAAVDVNNDGAVDLIVTNNTSAQITILLGNGSGGFTAGNSYATGNGPQGIAATDFNNDGNADLVVANTTDGTVTVLLGNGDGTFAVSATPTVGTSPVSVAVGDVNNNGTIDIVTANSGTGNASVLLGNGDGTFAAAVNYPSGTQSYWVTLADVNGDHLPDIIVADALSSGANISVLTNKSAMPGTFNTRASYASGNTPHYVATGDFNSDGVLDLFVVNRGTSSGYTYSILTGTGTGTFNPTSNITVGNAPWAGVIGDFNGDGRTDVAVTSTVDNKIYVALGVGVYPNMTVAITHAASFQQGQANATYTITVSNAGAFISSGVVTVTDSLPAGLTATAISGSGWTCTLSPLSCNRNDPLGASLDYPAITLTVSVAPDATATVTNSATVSGGGEVITNDDTSTDPTIVIQNTTLTLSSSLNPSISGNSVGLTATVSGSAATGSVMFYDGGVPLKSITVTAGEAVLSTSILTAGSHAITARYGGDSQFAGSSTASALSQVVTTQPQNGFQAAVQYGTSNASPSGVAIADFNGDGKPDMVLSSSSSVGKISFLAGHGDGTFGTAAPFTAGGTNSAGYAIVAADFNSDGAMDVAVANNGTNTVSILLGNGDGTFRTAVNSAAGSHPQHLVAGDFNRDGIPDLAVADFGSGLMTIMLGKGDGTFTSHTNTVGTNPRALVAGDFNGDGYTDLAVANSGANTILILTGNGNGTFSTGQTYTVGTTPQSLAAGDFNLDGSIDIAVANNGSNSVTILLGNGDATFTVSGGTSGYAAGTNPTGVVANDFNGDGIPDLAVSDAGGGVSLLTGVGDGSFQAPLSYAAGTMPGALATADFDGDGLSDLAVGNQGASNVSILLGGLFYADPTVLTSHTGSFTQGQTGAQYTLAVSNVGQYPTVSTVTVVDSLSSGLTATGISGTGWNCVLAGLTCTRTDALQPGNSYPSITVTVNVSSSAAKQVTNTATVSGGHESNAGNDVSADPTTVIQLTTLSLQPDTAPWVYGATVNLVATVSASDATGTVTFQQGSNVIGTAPVTNGVATLPAPSLTPGSYQFTAVYGGSSVYAGSNTSISATVSKATATVTLTGLAVTWDGTPKPVTVSTNPANLTVQVTYAGSTTAPSDAGAYAVVATVKDSNYSGSASGTLVINSVHATVTLTIPSPTYDGTAHAATASTSPNGLSVSITYSGLSTAPTVAGTYSVLALVTSPNYSGSASGTLVISQAPLSITLGGLNVTYDGTAKAASLTLSPLGIATTVTYNGKSALPIAAGSYSVSASSADSNYSGSATGVLVIAKASVTYTLNNLTTVYNGTAQSAQVTSSPAGVSFATTYSGSNAPTAAGSYNLAVATLDSNYAGSASGTFTIQKATPVVTWATPLAIPFGSPLTTVQLNAKSATAGAFTYTPVVGTVLTPGSQSLSVQFLPTDANNYNSVSGSNSITINPGTVTGVSLLNSKILSRDANNNIVVVVIMANAGLTDATNVTVTGLKIGSTSATPLPFIVGTIPSNTFVQATFTVPGTVGASGAASTWAVTGTFTGGSFNTSGRTALP